MLFQKDSNKLIQFIVFHLILALVLSYCKSKQESTSPIIENISESVYASGIVKSKNQYQVFSTVSGIIDQIFVEEGDTLKKNEAILKILNVTSDINAENAKLTADLANFNTKGERLNELKSNIEIAQIKLKSDSLLWYRQKTLWSQNIGTLVEFEQRELNFKNAKSNYQIAVLRYQESKRQFDIAAQQAKNTLKISTSLKSDFILRSESDGKVYSILKERGELINQASPVAIVGDANDFILELEVDEFDITKLKLNQRLILNLDSYKGQVFNARITKISSIMNERARSFKVEAGFTEKPPLLFPNLTVEANIVIQWKANAMTIPREYLINDSFVLNADNKLIQLEIGLKDYKKVEILNGLKITDVINKPGK